MDQSEPVKTVPVLECGNQTRNCRRARCSLWPIVPDQRKEETFPCHHIPLNGALETIASIMEKGDRDRLQEHVLEWIKQLPLNKKTLVWESGLLTALLYEIQPLEKCLEQWFV
ncbi:MAG: hypothetical protein ACHQKY_09055 [Terriglobia bacterium]|jgi:hypothetical protein